jgi:predicted nucleic acid-binding protein
VTRAFVDTNVLAYLFDSRTPDKQARAEQILRGGDDLVLSTQVMLELHSVLTRKFAPPLPPADATAVLMELQRFEIVVTDADLVVAASRTVTSHQMSIWDAAIVEAARLGQCDELWSEDFTDGAIIRGVRIVNPF